jgi:hypothetical protein
MDNPLYPATMTIGGTSTTYNAPKVLGVRIHADQSFDLQYTFVKSDGTTAFDIAGTTSTLSVSAYKNVEFTPVVLVSGVLSDSGSGTTDRVTFTVPADAIPEEIAAFPLRTPGNAVFFAIIADGSGKKIEVVAEVNIFDTDYALTGEANPSAQTIVPVKNDLGSVESSNLTTPPTPTLNTAYIVGASATGLWAGQDNDLAIGTGTAWVFLTPLEGNFVYDKNQVVQIIFNGTAWASLAGSPFTDADPLIKNAADATKLIGFDASGITTGTERTITMPDADVDLADIATNNAKVTNATHTGDATGATALTLESVAITGKTLVTVDDADHVLISDTSDSGNLKKVLASDFGGGGGGNFPTSTDSGDKTAAYSIIAGDENTTVVAGSATSADFTITYDLSLWTTAGSLLTIANESAYIVRVLVSNTGTMTIGGGIDKFIGPNGTITMAADTATHVRVVART